MQPCLTPRWRRLAGLVAFVLLVLATYWCLRLAWADLLFRRDTLESVRQASHLVPANAEYSARLAVLDPARSLPALRAALERNPRDAEGWIDLGLAFEKSRQYEEAEKALLEAARIDATYDPRWTLANYYFRRGQWEKFWPWIKRALAISYADRSPLFRLCWEATDDSEVILARAIPETSQVEAHYLQFLLTTERLGVAAPVARRLLRRRDQGAAPVLLAFCDRLLQADRPEEALQVWNGLSEAGLIPYGRLDPSKGECLTNGTFSRPPEGKGFDWRFPPVPGVSVSRTPSFLRLALAGRQPERCRLMEQYVPLEPGRRYRLRCHYRTAGVRPGSGLYWAVTGAGGRLESERMDLASEDWTDGQVVFTVPQGKGLAILSLGYERSLGTTRLEGSLFLRRVELAPAD